MNKLNLLAYPIVALVSLAAAVTAHAESPTPDDTATQVWSITKTRAQVQSELVAARADGSIKFHSTSYNPLLAARTTRTREEVRAVARAEHAADYNVAMYGEDSGSFYLSRQQRPREAGRLLAAGPTKAPQ
jgi:subtilisin family serine protease